MTLLPAQYPTGGALPPPTAFPAPTPFPAPNPDPFTFGMTTYQRMSPAGMFLPPPTQAQAPAPTTTGNAYLDRLNEALGSPGGVTNTMSLSDAQAQTDRAIARIAAVNPELAQQISAQRGGQQQEDNGRGFWGSILHAVASSPIGKALEIISRPAHIIPEILTDKSDSIWKNIGDALSGHSTATMGDYLKQQGLLQGNDIFSRAARGVTGFFLDMAVDPLTYVTAGLGAVGRAAATRFAAKTAARAVMYEEGTSILDRMATDLGHDAIGAVEGMSTKEVRAKAFEYMWRKATGVGGSFTRMGKWGSLAEDLSIVNKEAMGGMLGINLRDGEAQTLLNAYHAADATHDLVGRFGWNRIGDRIAEQYGIPKEAMNAILADAKKTGFFQMGGGRLGREAYMEARYAGALGGGIRISIPGLRIITPAIWGTQKMDFSILRRFFSGLSGQMRIMKAVESGTLAADVGQAALELGAQGGWKAIKAGSPQVAKLFDSVTGNLGSAFASASTQVGGITRNLGTYGLLRGGGLGDALAADARKMVRTAKGRIQTEALTLEVGNSYAPTLFDTLGEHAAKLDAVGDVMKRGTGQLSGPEFQRTLHQLVRQATKGSDDPTLVIRLLEAFPTEEAQLMGAQKYYDLLEANLAQRFEGPELEEKLAKLHVRRDVALEVEKKAAEVPEAGLAARMYRVAANQTRDLYNEFGGHARNLTTAVEGEAVINPLNREVVETGHAVQHGKTFVLEGPDVPTGKPGFTLEDVTDGENGRGYQLVEHDPEQMPEVPLPPEAPPKVPTPEAPAGTPAARAEALRPQLEELNRIYDEEVVPLLDAGAKKGDPKLVAAAEKYRAKYIEYANAVEASGSSLHIGEVTAQGAANLKPEELVHKLVGRSPVDEVVSAHEARIVAGERFQTPQAPAVAEMPAKDLVQYLEFPDRAKVTPAGMRGRTVEQMRELTASLKEGWKGDPIVVEVNQETGERIIREGHHRVGLAAELNMDIPVELRTIGVEPNVRYTHEVQLESYESMAAKRELEKGAPYQRDISPLEGAPERVDYQTEVQAQTEAQSFLDKNDIGPKPAESFPREKLARGGNTVMSDTQLDINVASSDIELDELHIANQGKGQDKWYIADAEGRRVGGYEGVHQPNQGWPSKRFAQDALDRMKEKVQKIRDAWDAAAPRDVQAEQAARGGIDAKEEAAIQDQFARNLQAKAAGGNLPEHQTQEELRASAGLAPKKDDRYYMPDEMPVRQLRASRDYTMPDKPVWKPGERAALKASINEKGLTESIKIAYDPDTGAFVVIDGNHRLNVMGVNDNAKVDWIPDAEMVKENLQHRAEEGGPALPVALKADRPDLQARLGSAGDASGGDPTITELAASYDVPAERRPLIEDFTKGDSLDPKWEKYRAVIAGEKPSRMSEKKWDSLNDEFWNQINDSISAWHEERYANNPLTKEWKTRSKRLTSWESRDKLATEIFGPQEAGGWHQLPPLDYQELAGPEVLDGEYATMLEVLGQNQGAADITLPRLEGISDKPSQYIEDISPQKNMEREHGPNIPTEDGAPAPTIQGPVPKKKAVLALKNPVIINKDEAALLAQGKRPLASTAEGGLDITAQADEFVQKSMDMFNEAWGPQIRRILASEKFSAKSEEVQKILTEMGLDPKGMSDELARITLETQDGMAARIRTAFYEARGHDGVITIENGKLRATAFESGFLTGDKTPIWQMSEDAPYILPDQGYFHYRMTSQAVEMVEGAGGHVERRAPRDWDAHFARQLHGLSFTEAEARMHEMYAEMGLNPSGVQLLDTDVAANLNAYVDGMANDMGNVYLGREARRLRAMGLTRSPFVGNNIGPVYESVPSKAYLHAGDWLRKQSEKLWELSDKAGRWQAKVAKQGQRDMKLIERSLAGVNERLQSAIDEETGKTIRALDRALNKERGVGMTAAEARAFVKEGGAENLVELRQIVKERGLRSKQASEVFRAHSEELLKEFKPGLRSQVANREADLARIAEKTDWKLNTMRDVTEEWNRIVHDASARVADVKVAVGFGDPDHVGMGKVLVPGLEGMYMPATMADEFNIAARGFKSLNDFQKVWRRYLSWWKEWATWAWPGFHIRNMMGGWFNNWLGGVEMKDYFETWRAMRARREVETGVEAKWSTTKLSKDFLRRHGLSDVWWGTEPTYADLAKYFTENGINTASSRSFGEARQGAELLDKQMAKPADSPWTLVDKALGRNTAAGKPGRVIAKHLRSTGEMTENMLRGASFLQGLKQTDGDVMGAHMFTMMRHGDYGDLSDWEYGAIRDILPFYKWMRTNVPLQIHQLFERPAHLMAVLHAKENLFSAMGVDYQNAKSKMPEWAMEGFSFPLPGSTDDAINLVSADLPMNDLYQGAGEFFSQLVPLARPFLESYVIDKSLFTGKPITGAPVKVSWVNDVPFLGKLLHGLGIGDVGADGSYYIDDKLQNVLGIVPVISRFRNWIYEDPNRAKLRGQTIISAMAGIGLRPFNEHDFLSSELDFYYSKVIPQMEFLRGIGYPLPTTDDLNNLYGASNNVLLAAGITPRSLGQEAA